VYHHDTHDVKVVQGVSSDFFIMMQTYNSKNSQLRNQLGGLECVVINSPEKSPKASFDLEDGMEDVNDGNSVLRRLLRTNGVWSWGIATTSSAQALSDKHLALVPLITVDDERSFTSPGDSLSTLVSVGDDFSLAGTSSTTPSW
jgi:hypothetical protein